MKQAVIFDMFETLITLYETPLYFSPEMAADAGVDLELFQPLWRATEEDRTLGRRTTEEVVESIMRATGCFDEERYRKVVEGRILSKRVVFDHLHEEILPMLTGLKERGVAVALISNCYLEEAAEIRNSVLFPYFDVLCLSCEEGLRKPGREIFKMCLERLGLSAKECLYVGDGGAHELDAALEIGMEPAQALWYLKPGSLQPITEEIPGFKHLARPLDVLKEIDQ